MWVKDYMCDWVNTIHQEKTLSDAVKQMVDQKTNSIVVVDDDEKPVGLVSTRLLIKQVVPEYLKDDPIFSMHGAEGTFDRYAEKAKDKKLEDFMIKEFHTLSEGDAMIEAAAYALRGAMRFMLVVNKDGKLVGAISRTCIKNALHNVLFKNKQIDPKKNNRDVKPSK